MLFDTNLMDLLWCTPQKQGHPSHPPPSVPAVSSRMEDKASSWLVTPWTAHISAEKREEKRKNLPPTKLGIISPTFKCKTNFYSTLAHQLSHSHHPTDLTKLGLAKTLHYAWSIQSYFCPKHWASSAMVVFRSFHWNLKKIKILAFKISLMMSNIFKVYHDNINHVKLEPWIAKAL